MLEKKFIGKPYAGKPHVRFDEGVGKVFDPSRSTLLFNSKISKNSNNLILNRQVLLFSMHLQSVRSFLPYMSGMQSR